MGPMATPINPGNVLDFDQPLNTNPDFTSTHVFSTADITGTYDGATQGVDGGIVDFTGTNGTKVTKEGVTLYPIDSEFGFYVTDFVGAEDKVIDGDYAEGWAGDFTVGGVQAGVVISDSPTDTFKTPAVLGTWLAGLGGNTVKASTEHYSVMQHVLSDQEYPGDTEALYELDDNLIMLSLNPAYNGQYVADLVNGTALYEGNPVVVEDVNIDGVVDIKDLLNPNESTIAYDIAYGDDYSVTMKDDGKLLYRWGNTIKRPNDVRLEAHLETPDEWKELDLFSSLKKLYKITSAELVTHHTITNNPNDQIRPEDYENESAIGTLPTYEVIENYNGETGRTVWASTDDYYAGDGTLYVAGTILRDTMLVAAVSGSIPDLIGTMAEDLELGFTNEWYTTMDREPFEPVLSADGTEYITGPRWRLLPDKYGQDLPSVTIPLDPSDPPPVQEGEEKYEVGAETQTVINLLDWETQISPLSISAGWQDNSGEVSINGLNMTEDFDVAFYIKGDIKPASLYSTELLVDYEEIQIYASGAAIVGTAADDYLVGVGLNEFTGGAGADLFVLSYGTTLTDVITASVVVDFEVGVDKLGLIGFDSLADFDIDLPVEAAALIVQGVSGDDLTISVDGQLVATLTGVAAALGVGATLDAGEGLSLLDSFIITNPSEGVDPGPVEPNVITGTSASETLTGTTGDDIIYGLAGNDYIYALAGDDVLDGGAGLDRLYGGPGADDFVFGVGTGIDFVYGFEDGIDQIQLDGIDFADVTIALYRTSDVMVTAGADIMILRAFDVANLTVDDFIPDPGLALG
ncbi:hypothetical protein SAMN06265370_14010 [Puniceibacterium sediminis]|uniref:Hemolysin-type calcium-binding repeat-containing protein n=2 Tax=Puniceibacterium sediminis TaxID=1608407 RepID=A0A238ZUE1_9RHOB|nr:hypothetical protein SAMN06265370_14010 [Puniceibacterium sediminis]